jgi:type VI secretion system protein ImpF
MADIEYTDQIVPSVLDRLIDENPGVSRDAPKLRVQAMRDLRRAVRRDIEALLNTRQTILDWTADMDEVEYSMIDFGSPDFSSLSLTSADAREKFRAQIEERIRKLEPRFKTVEVQLVANADPLDRTLRFRIDAWIYVDPAPERVDFDSLLEPVSRSFTVKGESGE